MDKNYETRHIFMALGICIFIYAPIFLSFMPQTVANILHHHDGTWYVFAPRENFIAFGVGFILLFVSSMILFLMDIKKVSVALSFIILFGCFGCFVTAAMSHKTLADDAISFSPILAFREYSYSWNDVDKVIFLFDEEKGFNEFEFLFTDGNKMTLFNDTYFRSIRYKFDQKITEMNIITESRE